MSVTAEQVGGQVTQVPSSGSLQLALQAEIDLDTDTEADLRTDRE